MNEQMQGTGGGETEDEDEKGGKREREREKKVEISVKSVIIANGSIQQSISISRCGGREKSAGTAD